MLCVRQLRELRERERWVKVLLEKSILTDDEQQWVEDQLVWLQNRLAEYEFQFCFTVEQYNILHARFVEFDAELSELLANGADCEERRRRECY